MSGRTTSTWLWMLVAVQVAIPASYYLVRDDRDDERFAWRMFSAVRMQRCEVDALEQDERGVLHPIEVSRSLHASWIRSFERGRARVIESFLTARCRPGVSGYPVAAAQLQRRCESAQGTQLPEVRYRFDCARGRFEASR